MIVPVLRGRFSRTDIPAVVAIVVEFLSATSPIRTAIDLTSCAFKVVVLVVSSPRGRGLLSAHKLAVLSDLITLDDLVMGLLALKDDRLAGCFLDDNRSRVLADDDRSVVRLEIFSRAGVSFKLIRLAARDVPFNVSLKTVFPHTLWGRWGRRSHDVLLVAKLSNFPLRWAFTFNLPLPLDYTVLKVASGSLPL